LIFFGYLQKQRPHLLEEAGPIDTPDIALIGSKNSKANRIETGERSGGIGEICSVEVDEK